MNSFLDKSGLIYFWEKIKSFFEKKSMDLYTCTFLMDSWVYYSGYYQQTAQWSCATDDNYKKPSSNSIIVSPPFCLSTDNSETNSILLDSLNIINEGHIINSWENGSCSIKVWEKPKSDIQVYYLIKNN